MIIIINYYDKNGIKKLKMIEKLISYNNIENEVTELNLN